MFFRRKRDPDKYPPPPWIKWVLIGFVVLAVLGNMREGSKVNTAFKKAGKDISSSSKNLVDIDEYKNKIFPTYNASMRVRDTKEGTGTAAICGQEVTIAYQAFFGDDKPIDNGVTKDKPLVFRIGEGKAMPALEQGVVGMKKGGKRSMYAPASMSYGIKEFARKDVPNTGMILFEVELLNVSPPLPSQHNAYRISVIQNAVGAPLLCGETVKAHVTMWSMAGKKLFSTKDKEPLTFTPGKSEVFLGLEQAVLGMPRKGLRTAIVPPEFQKTMSGKAPKIDFPFPKEQTVLVDIEALP